MQSEVNQDISESDLDKAYFEMCGDELCARFKEVKGSIRRGWRKHVYKCLNLPKERYYMVLLGYSGMIITKHVIAKFVNGRHNIFELKSGSFDESGNDLVPKMGYIHPSRDGSLGYIQGYSELSAEEANIMQIRGKLTIMKNSTANVAAKHRTDFNKMFPSIPFPDLEQNK